jgi:hypothetical protein
MQQADQFLYKQIQKFVLENSKLLIRDSTVTTSDLLEE